MATQKLRNFVVVAEELNLSRAAPRLFVTQQALSKQLRDLEEAVGVRLLDRSTRRMALTPAGQEVTPPPTPTTATGPATG
ncbi:LysR family transcriptional regulator, partial [Streptomyces cavourensis]|nr:LysR family transcriptional regulator [Streptomyces cavourensis]